MAVKRTHIKITNSNIYSFMEVKGQDVLSFICLFSDVIVSSFGINMCNLPIRHKLRFMSKFFFTVVLNALLDDVFILIKIPLHAIPSSFSLLNDRYFVISFGHYRDVFLQFLFEE